MFVEHTLRASTLEDNHRNQTRIRSNLNHHRARITRVECREIPRKHRQTREVERRIYREIADHIHRAHSHIIREKRARRQCRIDGDRAESGSGRSKRADRPIGR